MMGIMDAWMKGGMDGRIEGGMDGWKDGFANASSSESNIVTRKYHVGPCGPKFQLPQS
jgi:hypothetical protein